MRLLPAGVCAAVLLTACGTDEEPPTDAAPTASATSTSPAPDDASAEQVPVGEGSTDASIATGDGPPVTVTDVRLGTHDGFDRIVFELAGDGEAGWRVAYTGDPRSQGSGAEVEVPGEAVLGITLTNIALPGDAPAGTEPWEGAGQQALPGATVLDALVEDTVFEGRYTFFAGLDARRPFAVAPLSSPQRIVIDLLDEDPAEPVALAESCESPAGFAISYPEEWAVNPGTEVPACTRFAPDSFSLPVASDARVAPVSLRVEGIPFDLVASTGAGEQLSRDEITVDGRPAVRIERVTAGEGLWPEGVPITSYVVDLGSGGGEPRTLVADTVGLPRFDYPRNVEVLDRMVGSLTFPEGG